MKGYLSFVRQISAINAPKANTKLLSVKPIGVFLIIVFRLVRDVVANHKTTRYAGAATKVIQKNHLA